MARVSGARAGRFYPQKYERRFLDYRVAQGTLVPYRTILMEDGKQIQETRILNVTYGIKIDDSLSRVRKHETPSQGRTSVCARPLCKEAHPEFAPAFHP